MKLESDSGSKLPWITESLRVVKVELALKISERIKQRGWNQITAALELGTSQASVSNIQQGRPDGCSMEKLCRFLMLLSNDIEIVLIPDDTHTDIPGTITVC